MLHPAMLPHWATHFRLSNWQLHVPLARYALILEAFTRICANLRQPCSQQGCKFCGGGCKTHGIMADTIRQTGASYVHYSRVASGRVLSGLDLAAASPAGDHPSSLYGKYTWRVPKFSDTSKRELRSKSFTVGDYKFYILVYPNGCDVCNHLSLFLCVADYDKLLPGAPARRRLCPRTWGARCPSWTRLPHKPSVQCRSRRACCGCCTAGGLKAA